MPSLWNYEKLAGVSFIIILIIFVFTFLTFKSKPIRYRVLRNYLQDNELITSYKENQDKYTKTKCEEMCDKIVCLNYGEQLKKYELCKRCSNRGLCYNPFSGSCERCIKLKSCEETYGCDGGKPKDPFLNECQECWPKIY